MKHILFVVPAMRFGGTISSLSSIHSCINEKCSITVFPLTRAREVSNSIGHILKPSLFLAAFHERVKDARGLYLFYVVAIKLLKIILKALGFDLASFLYSREAIKIEKTSKYDYVVAFEEGSPTHFVSFFKCSNRYAWIHCDYERYCPQGTHELKYYNCYDRIVCVSKYTMRVFLQRFPSLINKTQYIYNLIDNKFIVSMAKESTDDERFINKGVTLISAGRIDPVKRFTLIPEIANYLIRNGACFRWYILGPDTNENELALLRTNIRKFGVENNVIWLGAKKNPYSYFVRSDIYVCLSSSEACPMVFNEALTLGVPVVSADFGSAKEFLQGGNGVFCPIDAISEHLLQLVKDPVKFEHLKNNAKCYITNHQSIKSIYSLFNI